MILDEDMSKVETVSKIQPETSSPGDLFFCFGVETLYLNLCAEYVFWGRKEVIIVLWLSVETLGKDTFPRAIPFFQLVAQGEKKKFSSLSLCPEWRESQKKLKVP